MSERKPILSIIITVFMSEENLKESFPRIIGLRDQIPDFELEFIFVVDGSPDDSLGLLRRYKEDHPFIKIISFTRNFGAVNGFLAGLAKSKGDCVTVLPSDLQDPPELLVEMVEQWRHGFKAVYAIRKKREDAPLTKWLASVYYFLLRAIAIQNYPKTGFDVFLIDRQVADELLNSQEKNSHIQNAVFMLGFEYAEIYYDRQERAHGKSSWTMAKKFKHFVDSFISYSYVPIRFMTLLGMLASMASFSYGLFIFIASFFIELEQPGWASLMVVMVFMLGTVMTMLGILGEYLWRILDEVRARSPYVIDEFYD
ncbi:MAG: glycosyltransferase [Pseudomonadales bacterium]|nr:glycosyltransferase [Pseudomonadales bacterium]